MLRPGTFLLLVLTSLTVGLLPNSGLADMPGFFDVAAPRDDTAQDRDSAQEGLAPRSMPAIGAMGIAVDDVSGRVLTGIQNQEEASGDGGLPTGTWGWETVPGVIRDDGREAFRVEVSTVGPVAGVSIAGISSSLIPPELEPIQLRDDGLGGDRVGGDFVFTSGPFRYETSFPMPSFYRSDPDSPAGLHILDVGSVSMEGLDGSMMFFANDPSVGILRSDILEISTSALSRDVVVAPHLINVRTNSLETQRFLRSLGGDLRILTNTIYEVLPDEFDFFMFLSTNRIENLLQTSSPNFQFGIHASAQVNYEGTGQRLFDNTDTYGSAGRLLGVNVLDAYERGLYSGNATHELVHQWVSFTSPSLGLSDGRGHYKSRSSVGSLVGGRSWVDNGDGTFTIECAEGGSGAHRAAPLDMYMMGLIDAAAVPSVYVYDEASPTPLLRCEEAVDNIDITVTVEDIQGIHGVRVPGPADAQRDFTIAFVAESHQRLLNPTEITFYEILAAHYTKRVPAEDPDPYVGLNWASIDRFFGEGTTWTSELPPASSTPTALPTPTPEPSLPGDANCDGDVNSIDAALILQLSVGFIDSVSCPKNADVNSDGRIDVTDSALILQIDAGILEVLAD